VVQPSKANMSELADALYSAAQRGLADRVTSLLAGVDVRGDAVRDAMRAALQIAIRNDHVAVVHILCAAGASFGLATHEFTILHVFPLSQAAGRRRRAKLASSATTEYARPQRYQRNGFQPIHLAASAGSVACVEALVAWFQVSPNSLDGARIKHDTPMHWACRHAHVDTVRQLLAAKAHTNSLSANNMGDTPLDTALIYGDTRVIATLLKSRPDTSALQKAHPRATRQCCRAVIRMVARALSLDGNHAVE